MAWSESALWMCPSCGTSNVEGTRYCERCGLPLVPPPPMGPALPVQPPVVRPTASPTTARPGSRREHVRRPMGRRRALAIVGVAVIAAVLLLAGVWFVLGIHVAQPTTPIAPPPVSSSQANVSVEQVSFNPPLCLNSANIRGGVVPSGDPLTTKVALYASGTVSCEVTTASSLTNGFQVIGSNMPVIVRPSAPGNLTITLSTPADLLNDGATYVYPSVIVSLSAVNLD
jgi:zinc-ribbon domain